MAYDSESEDIRDAVEFQRHSGGTTFSNSRATALASHWNAYGTSPSSSMGSLGPPSPTPRPRAATATDATPGFYVTMTPINSSKISVSISPDVNVIWRSYNDLMG